MIENDVKSISWSCVTNVSLNDTLLLRASFKFDCNQVTTLFENKQFYDLQDS